MHRILLAMLSMCVSIQAQAFPCFITLVKDSCWANYNVTVAVSNPTTGKQITTVDVPKGKSWARQQFDCQPGDALSFSASFTPVFWENGAGKTYPGVREWFLPAQIGKGDTAWNITLCYSQEFAEVPLPPDASGNCTCNMDNIPPVKPQ